MDDTVINVKQIAQYAQKGATAIGDRALVQTGGVGGPYNSMDPADLVGTALTRGGFLRLAAERAGGILFGTDGLLTWEGGIFNFADPIYAPAVHADRMTILGQEVATVTALDEALANLANVVTSFNGRTGAIMLMPEDIMRGGGAPIYSPHFDGWVTAPTNWDVRRNDDTVATTEWVHMVLQGGYAVTSFMGRTGDITLTDDDISAACMAPGAMPRTSQPVTGDDSQRIATTHFVQDSISGIEADLKAYVDQEIEDALAANVDMFAPLDSPNFTGHPTAPTPAPGDSTGNLATTAFVQAAVSSGVAGVSSFNTRVGAVVLTAADVTGVGGALLASPTFTGVPGAPTAAPGTATPQLATCAFVTAAVGAVSIGVSSFNTRTGAVSLNLTDITTAGGAPLAGPGFTGVPTAPTATGGTSTNQIATCAFVQGAVNSSVVSFNSRTGAVTLNNNDITAAGGALLAGPAFTGTPTAPTAAPGTNTTQLATTAFVAAAVAAVGATGVTSFNTRTGAVTLILADITGAGGAPIASPGLTGVPTAPTAAPATNTGQIATCAFVQNEISAGTAGVASFNTRTGVVTLLAADITSAGGALLASPSFSGAPLAPTAATVTNNTQIATTAFVKNAIGTPVLTFNSRSGAVTLIGADISAAGGALLASPTFTGTPAAPTAATADSSTTLATTAFVHNVIATAGGVSTFNTRAGAVTLLAADVTGVGGALLASPTFTGTPAAPTATAGTNTTQLATTAFVTGAITAAAVPGPSSTTPVMDGAAAIGVATTYARADHVHPTDTSRAPLASPTFTGVPAAPTAAPGTNTTQLSTTAFVTAAIATAVLLAGSTMTGPLLLNADPTAPLGAATKQYVDAKAGSPGAPLGWYSATINPTNTTAAISSVQTATNSITFNAAHGITTGMSAVVTGTVPAGGLTANDAYYCNALSATTLAFYTTLANALADTSRISITGSGTAWVVRPLLRQNEVNVGFNTSAPVGAITGNGSIGFELNLATALRGTVGCVVLFQAFALYNAAGTPAAVNQWAIKQLPVIVSTTLIQLPQAGGVGDGNTNNAGTWASQAQNAFQIKIVVWG